MSLFPKFQNQESKTTEPAIPATPATFSTVNSGNSENSNPTLLDITNPETKKTPRLDLLTEIELEAFNGWYATMRKPKHGMSHEEAELLAWQFLMESMEIMCKEGRGRYAKDK